MKHSSGAITSLALIVSASVLSFDAEAITMRVGFAQPDQFGSPWPSIGDLNFSTDVSIWRGTPFQLVAVLEGFEGELIYGAQVDLRESYPLGRVGDEQINREVAVYGPPPPEYPQGNPLWEWGRYRGEATFYLDRSYYYAYANYFGLDPNVPFAAISGDGSFSRISPTANCLVDYGSEPPPPELGLPYDYPCTRTYVLSYRFGTTAGGFSGGDQINIHVPEPGTLALLGLGLVGLGVSRRRKH